MFSAGIARASTRLVRTFMTEPMPHSPHERTLPNQEAFDIAANRAARKWTRWELVGRLLWEVVGVPAFAWSPRPAWAFRRCLLRLFGAKIGGDVHLYPTVKIAVPWHLTIEEEVAVGDGAILYNLGPITIGRRATISQHAHLCAGTHDFRRASFDLLKQPIEIGPDAWICADAFVGPGVSIGERTILGARGVAMRDLPAGVIAAGNPAQPIKPRPGLSA